MAPGLTTLTLSLLRAPRELDRRAALLELLEQEVGRGIVYASNVDAASDLFHWIGAGEARVPVAEYHAGMSARDRLQSRSRFEGGIVRVIVATHDCSAELSIGNADVRFIVHYAPPASIDAFIEMGRRGDGQGMPVRCLVLVAR